MKKTVAGSEKYLSAACCLLLAAIFYGCATPQLPPRPPKYVYQDDKADKAAHSTSNSLWVETAGLYEDVKARRLNDLVTIDVTENISGSGTADTAASKSSTLDAAITDFFGAPLNLNRNNIFGQGKTFSPTASGSMKDDFKGAGATKREGKLIGTITAKVVEVMPNGNLIVESRKEITVNNEKQILILMGMIRPDDIAADNSVPSSKVADAQVYFVGDGIIQDKQSPGWLVKFFDRVWPF